MNASRLTTNVILTVTGGCLLLAVPTRAFVCIAAPNNGPCVHWATGAATLNLHLGSAGGTLINGTTSWDTNAVNAANDWTAVGADFHYDLATGPFSDPCVTQPGNGCPGDPGGNPVVWAPQTCNGMGFGDIVAATVNCFNTSSGALVNAPVFVNSTAPFNAYDGPLMAGVNDIRRVLLHEFGHVLGLNHPNDAGQTVTAIMNGHESDVDRLQPDDIAGIFSLYPNGGGTTTNSMSTGCRISPTDSVQALCLLVLPAVFAVWRRKSGQRPRGREPIA